MACSATRQPPAPIGDYSALERLAASFREIADLDPQPPASLPLKQRKTLVERVFKHAGYDYGYTLQALATANLNAWDRTHRDLVELVVFPHRGVQASDQLASIYSAQELAYIAVLEQYLNTTSSSSSR